MANEVIASCAKNSEGVKYAEVVIKPIPEEATFIKHHFACDISNGGMGADYGRVLPCKEWIPEEEDQPKYVILKNITKDITLELEVKTSAEEFYETTQNWIGDTIRLEPKNATCKEVILMINTEHTPIQH